MAVGDLDLNSLAMRETLFRMAEEAMRNSFLERVRHRSAHISDTFLFGEGSSSTGPHFDITVVVSSTGDLPSGFMPVRVGVALRRRVRELQL